MYEYHVRRKVESKLFDRKLYVRWLDGVCICKLINFNAYVALTVCGWFVFRENCTFINNNITSEIVWVTSKISFDNSMKGYLALLQVIHISL